MLSTIQVITKLTTTGSVKADCMRLFGGKYRFNGHLSITVCFTNAPSPNNLHYLYIVPGNKFVLYAY